LLGGDEKFTQNLVGNPEEEITLGRLEVEKIILKRILRKYYIKV
jgi:hypothetical protein